MRKQNPARLLLPLAVLCALAAFARAQAPTDTRGALSTFPDSEAVLFVNVHRVVNEVMPKVMSAAEYQKMLADAKSAGFDVRGLQFAAAGVRFNADAPAGTPPDFVIVVKGNFNADSLLMLGKVGLAAKDLPSRTETYGSKSIEIIDAATIAKMMGKGGGADEGADGEGPRQKPLPYKELAVAALDSNTLVAGVPSYVRAAVDASGGRGALRPSLLSLASQEPDALWSLTAELPPDLVEMLHKYGMPANAQADQLIGWVKQLNVSQGMTPLDFTLSAAMTTDSPEHASAFSGLVRMGTVAAESMLRTEASKDNPKDAAKARQALAVISSLVNRTDGSTLYLRASVPQKTVIDLINEERTQRGDSKYILKKKQPRKARRRARRR